MCVFDVAYLMRRDDGSVICLWQHMLCGRLGLLCGRRALQAFTGKHMVVTHCTRLFEGNVSVRAQL